MRPSKSGGTGVSLVYGGTAPSGTGSASFQRAVADILPVHVGYAGRMPAFARKMRALPPIPDPLPCE